MFWQNQALSCKHIYIRTSGEEKKKKSLSLLHVFVRIVSETESSLGIKCLVMASWHSRDLNSHPSGHDVEA